ncbi:MAG TPA: hypothetical protein VGK48_20855 [Terriglobia bacterium]|jgi:hypothetical protein
MDIAEQLMEVLSRLGRIEGQLIGINKVSERVSRLEMWQAWLKGGLCAVLGAFGYLFRKV